MLTDTVQSSGGLKLRNGGQFQGKEAGGPLSLLRGRAASVMAPCKVNAERFLSYRKSENPL